MNWWTTSLSPEDYNSLQNPEYVYCPLMSKPMLNQHMFDSVVESTYLLDTKENRMAEDLACGFENEDIINMLLGGTSKNDFVSFRKNVCHLLSNFLGGHDSSEDDPDSRRANGIGHTQTDVFQEIRSHLDSVMSSDDSSVSSSRRDRGFSLAQVSTETEQDVANP